MARSRALKQMLKPTLRFLAILACVQLVAVIAASSSAADSFIGSAGSGDGQIGEAWDVDADQQLELIYVPDRSNNRVSVFRPDGSFVKAFGWGVATGADVLETCFADCREGIASKAPGRLDGPRQIAVDNFATSPFRHTVYVTSHGEILRFEPGGETDPVAFIDSWGGLGKGTDQFFRSDFPIAVGPDGTVYAGDSETNKTAADNRVQAFTPAGELLTSFPTEPESEIQAIAVSSDGTIYVGGGIDGRPLGREGAVFEYDQSGALLDTIETVTEAASLALDSAGNLYVGTWVDGPDLQPEVRKFDPSGAQSAVMYGNLSSIAIGMVLLPTVHGDIVAVERRPSGATRAAYFSFPPPGPQIASATVTANAVGSVKATVQASINPQGEESTFHVEYLTEDEFESGGFSNPNVKSTPESAVDGAGFIGVAVDQLVGCADAVTEASQCLEPGTKYFFRVVATNPAGTTNSETRSFETLPSFAIEGPWSTEVGLDGAKLHVAVNPLGVAASGYFEYVSDAAFQASGFANAVQVPDVGGGAQPFAIGNGETPVPFEVAIAGLEQGTEYHYRFVATNRYGTVGPEGRLRTPLPPIADTACGNQVFRVGLGAALPDCRAYEMVSPLEKENGDVLSPLNLSAYPTEIGQATSNGEAATFTSYRAFAGPDSAPYASQYLARRGPGGWETDSISAPRTGEPIYGNNSLRGEFEDFTEDLSRGWILRDVGPVLDPSAPEGYPNLFRRDNSTGAYTALINVKPPRVKPLAFVPRMEGATAGGDEAVFSANDKLTPNASGAVANTDGYPTQLYQATASGELRLVSVLPDGKPVGLIGGIPADVSLGSGNLGTSPDLAVNSNRNALSEDGARAYWSVAGTLYLRRNSGQPQSPMVGGACADPSLGCTVSLSATVPDGSGSYFQAASKSGDSALFSATPSGSLYLYDADSNSSTLIAPRTEGAVLGASDDLTRFYFASGAVLAGANPAGASPEEFQSADGKANLYLFDGSRSGTDRYRFIGTLQGTDLTPEESPLTTVPALRSARVSRDGEHLLFSSEAPLTGYDNRDAASGARDTEVFIYDAAEDLLRCVSCNPTGARPRGVLVSSFTPGGELPNWTAGMLPGAQTQSHNSRLVSADGKRAFFISYDALALADANGKADVYQWQEAGTGGCSGSDPEFSPYNDGCINLISSGKGSSDSYLVDASASGDDVFIRTISSLVPQDYGLYDLYDARVGGGFPVPPSAPPECAGEECQPAAAPPAVTAPASGLPRADGNVAAGKKKHGKGKKKHKKHKKRGKGKKHSGGRK